MIASAVKLLEAVLETIASAVKLLAIVLRTIASAVIDDDCITLIWIGSLTALAVSSL